MCNSIAIYPIIRHQIIFATFLGILPTSILASQPPIFTPTSCPQSQILCDGTVCYDPATHSCDEFSQSIQCIAVCESHCFNPTTHSCLNGTVCSLGQQLCLVQYNSSNRWQYSSPKYECYDPTQQACFNNTLCEHPSRSCNQQCLKFNEVCVNDTTICKVPTYNSNYKAGQIQLCNGVCYNSSIQKCVNDSVKCMKNCSHVCYNPSSQICLNGTLCSLGQQLCLVKYFTSDGAKYNSPKYQCYDPASKACFNNTLCDHPSRSCNQQCLKEKELCVNNLTICKVQGYYSDYKASQIQLCNGVCYDSSMKQCVNGSVECIKNCSHICYNPSSQKCLNEILCRLDEQLCLAKYFTWRGPKYYSLKYQCYDPTSKACFNNTLCEHPSRSCNQQCLEDNEVCVNDTTICKVEKYYYYYKDDQIQLCNGVCYDSAIQQCVNDRLKCGKNCSDLCYNPSSQICLNGTLCSFGEQLCHVKYTTYGWSPKYECYNPTQQACFNNTLCEHPSRSCNQQCLKHNEVCVNDSTICKVEKYYYNYKDDQIQLCNGVCYDSAIQQCVNDRLKCMKNCSHLCYNPSSQFCFNGTVCSLDEQLCHVQYSSYEVPYISPKYECYDPTSKACFNNTLCNHPSRSCNQQCLEDKEVCVNDSTICKLERHYYTYEDDQIQLCSGVCYDSAIQQCVNDRLKCMKNCSDLCYNPSSQSCLNGTVCSLDEQLCLVKYSASDGSKYYSPKYECYDLTQQACFNNTLCNHPSRSCNQQCIKEGEVCVNGTTICQGPWYYSYFKAGRIQSCNGVCYDSAIEKCGNGYKLSKIMNNSSDDTEV